MILLALFVIGAHVGSFLNVCIWRLPRGESVAHPPSRCPGCERRLTFLDMVPILSQSVLRSRCRYCGNKFSWRYAIIEFITGVLFLILGLQPGWIDGGWWIGSWNGDGVRLVQWMFLVSCLVVIFMIDFDTMMIPISAALIAGTAGVASDGWHVYQEAGHLSDGSMLWFHILPAPMPGSLLSMAVAGAAVGLVRAFFSWVYQREAMGFGDVFLVAAIAANIGWSEQIVTFFFLSIFIALAGGMLLQMPRVIKVYRRARPRDAKRKEKGLPALALPLARHTFRKLEMPFGPSLAVGAYLTVLYGGPITQSYLNWANPPMAIDQGQLR